jgi:hypothetical protein
MLSAMVTIILDKIYNKTVPKPINLRPGYDMEHVFNSCPQTDNYQYEKVVEIEKQYDYLSIIRPHETPQQWANRIRAPLQELLSKREYSLYHVYSLFASFGQVKSTTYYVNGELYGTPFDYRRPSVHKSQMAICFKCWKLIKIAEVKPRKVYYSGWVYEVKSEDLIKNHWDNLCFKTNKHKEAHLLASSKSEILREKSSDRRGVLYPEKNTPDSLPQFDRTNGSEIFISSIYAKQNNLNHLNQPKGTALRLRDGTVIKFV